MLAEKAYQFFPISEFAFLWGCGQAWRNLAGVRLSKLSKFRENLGPCPAAGSTLEHIGARSVVRGIKNATPVRNPCIATVAVNKSRAVWRGRR